MRFSKALRLLAVMLAVLTLVGPVSVSAADGDTGTQSGLNGLVEMSDDLIFISYQDYLIKYLDVPDETYVAEALEEQRAKPGDEFSFSAADYVKEGTTADVEVVTHNGRRCISIGEEGLVTWKFNVKKEGFYTLSFNYCSDSQRSSSIEKIFYMNEKVPFQETRYFAVKKLWEYSYPEEYTLGYGLDGQIFDYDRFHASRPVKDPRIHVAEHDIFALPDRNVENTGDLIRSYNLVRVVFPGKFYVLMVRQLFRDLKGSEQIGESRFGVDHNAVLPGFL